MVFFNGITMKGNENITMLLISFHKRFPDLPPSPQGTIENPFRQLEHEGQKTNDLHM